MIPSYISEGDPSSVIKLIQSNENILSDIGLIIENIHLAFLE